MPEKTQPFKEKLGWNCTATIKKYESDDDYKNDKPYEVSKAEKNVALNEGLQAIIELMGGISSPTLWDNTNARIGVGISSTAAAATQTGLQGGTTTYQSMDTGFPQRSSQSLQFQAVFGGSSANHAWEEFTVVNAASDTGDNLNRLVSSQGTKQSGQTWTIQIDLDFS